MEPFIKWYKSIQSVSAVIAIASQGIVLKYIYPEYKSIGILSAIFGASFLYFGMYRLMLFFFQWKVWRLVLRELNIDGEWYHEFQAFSPQDYCRRGITTIKQKMLKISVDGRNFNPDFEPPLTLWESTAVSLDEWGHLVISYVAHRSSSSDKSDLVEKTGIMRITIVLKDKVPHTMYGVFYDSYPSTIRGMVKWSKSPPDWVAQMQEKNP